MARLTLYRHWSAQSLRDQDEFVRLFTALLERCYLSTIEHYAGAGITFLGESIDGSYAQVQSRIATDRRVEISIDDRLIDRGDRWEVYDVVLDSVGLVSNYRSQFNSIIRTSVLRGAVDEASKQADPGVCGSARRPRVVTTQTCS